MLRDEHHIEIVRQDDNATIRTIVEVMIPFGAEVDICDEPI